MGLPWVRLDTAFPFNPKLLAMLSEKDGHRAALAWVCGLAYSGGHGTDGFIPRQSLPFLHARPSDAERLVRFGFWWPKDGGWVINGWDEYQQSNSETQQRRERLSVAARKANCVRWHGPDCGCWADSQ